MHGYRRETVDVDVLLITAPHRLRDLADVQELIKLRKPGRDLADRLDASVRTNYVELWDSVNGASLNTFEET
jgi:hypothetical protein